jgi:hypothetical protein
MIWMMAGFILIPGALWTTWIIRRWVSPSSTSEVEHQTLTSTGNQAQGYIDTTK